MCVLVCILCVLVLPSIVESVSVSKCYINIDGFSFSLPLIQEGQLSVSGERMCTKLVNCLED